MIQRRACPYCREEIASDARRCSHCGARLPAMWNRGGPDWLVHFRLRNLAILLVVIVGGVCAFQR
jgi:predicted amidophosphoribosyltransferase